MRPDLWWMLWSSWAALAWLLPMHAVPWTTFQGELAIATALIVWVIVVALRSTPTWTLDFASATFFLAGLIPLLQAAAGLFVVPAEAPLVSAYLFGAGLVAWAARTDETRVPGAAIRALFVSFVIGALGSTALALIQWLQVDVGTSLIAPPSPDLRTVANVGQPNNLATLLVWGLIGLWWLWASRRAAAWSVVPTAALMLLALSSTGSRAGVVEVAMVGAAAFALRRRIRIGSTWVWSALGIWSLSTALALPAITGELFGGGIRALTDLASPRERTMLLRVDFAEIAARPWAGWGWNQNIVGHVELHDRFPIGGEVGNAHNLILDLLIWNGVPLGTAIIAAIAAWMFIVFRSSGSLEQTFCKVALLTLGVHCMLELPHVLAYFFLPAAMMIGALSAGRFEVVRVHRAIPAVAAFSAAIYLVLLTHDYLTIEENLRSARMRAAGIHGAAAESNPPMRILGALQNTLYVLRTEPIRNMDPKLLDSMRRAATRFPAVPGLLRYAYAASLNHQPANAEWALGVICALNPESECRNAEHSWTMLQHGGANPELSSVRTPWGSRT